MQTVARSPVWCRWMIRADVPAVLRIEAASYFNGWPEEDFLHALRQRNCIGQVAELGDTIVGFVIYSLHKDYINVLNLAVHPEHRWQGVGRTMLGKLKSRLSHNRRTRITIVIPETNAGAVSFLRRERFLAEAVVRGYFDHTEEDGYRFAYDLDADPERREEAEVKVTGCDW